jgi:transglutaminase-like putative cysteine protease
LPDNVGNEINREPLYLRGVAYNHYNGKSWSNHLPHRRTLVELPEGTFTLRTPGGSPPTPARRLRQEILLEPLDTSVLFGAPLPAAVKGNFLSVHSDLMGSLHLAVPPRARVQYTAYSMPTHLSSAEQTATAVVYPEFILRQYLHVPPVNSQIIELARRITQPAASVAQTVSLIRTHLLANYRYNLDVPSLESDHPLEDFLLTRKTGYCEHYATAMVVMLRLVGVPARFVTGFLATEWNEFGGYYTVRQRDAHAWVEVYFPQSGWITMDPTPPVPAAAGQTWWLAADRVMDSARLRWDRFFLHYNMQDQLTIVQGIRESGEVVRTTMSEALTALSAQSAAMLDHVRKALTPSGIPQIAVFLSLTIGVGYSLRRLLRGNRREAAQQDFFSPQQHVVITLYSNMLHCFARHGIIKPSSTTPLEFLRQIREQWAEAWPWADALTQLYIRVRFGQIPLTAEERTRAENLLRTLRTLEPPNPSLQRANVHPPCPGASSGS